MENRIFRGTPQHLYTKVRMEGPGPIPCDPCMGGMDAPWHIAYYLGDPEQIVNNTAPIAYVVCAACAYSIASLVDICSDCVTDPTDERVCDNCGKEYRRKRPAVEVAA